MVDLIQETLALELGVVALLILSLVTNITVFASFPAVMLMALVLTVLNALSMFQLSTFKAWGSSRWMLMLTLLGVFIFVLGLIIARALLSLLIILGIVVMLLLLLAIVFYPARKARKVNSDQAVNAWKEAIKLKEAIADMEETKKDEVFVASSTGKSFHSADCIVARNIKKSSKLTFDSENEAIRQGYSRCRVCLEARN